MHTLFHKLKSIHLREMIYPAVTALIFLAAILVFIWTVAFLVETVHLITDIHEPRAEESIFFDGAKASKVAERFGAQ